MKKGLLWLAVGVGVLLLAGLLWLGGGVAYELVAGPQVADFTNVTYPAEDGTLLQGYLAQPEGEGQFPAVLLIHEWWGLNEDITKIAETLAQEGYVVLAPDSYRGQTTTQVARALYLATQTPAQQIDGDLDAGLAYLRGLPQVDGGNTAVFGFCFGGREAFGLGTRHGDITAVVDYYGGGVEVSSPADLGQMQAAFLGIFGEEDTSIPLENISALESALVAAGLPHQIIIYPGVGHAFLDSENLSDLDHPAGQAWQVTLTFLDEVLRD
jgi:carboxymethylenebutenolidase